MKGGYRHLAVKLYSETGWSKFRFIYAIYTSMAWRLITSLDELVDRYHHPSIDKIDGREDRSD